MPACQPKGLGSLNAVLADCFVVDCITRLQHPVNQGRQSLILERGLGGERREVPTLTVLYF